MTPCKFFAVTISVIASFCLLISSALAEPKTFTVDQTQSSLFISGTVSGFAFEPQGSGSLTTSYTGTIEVDLTDSELTFTGGSLIAGVNNGTWQPGIGGGAGGAPANYGGSAFLIVASGVAAVRNVLLDVTSAPITLANGAFAATNLVFSFAPSATTAIDYSFTGLISGNGTRTLSGEFTNANPANATLQMQGAELILTLPVDISGVATAQSPNDVQYRLRGQIVARAAAPVTLAIESFEINAGQLEFTISTLPGASYTILSSTNLTDWPTAIDQFTATNNPTTRGIPLPSLLPEQFFRVRQD